MPIKHLSISSSAKSIGKHIFEGHSSLNKILIPDSLNCNKNDECIRNKYNNILIKCIIWILAYMLYTGFNSLKYDMEIIIKYFWRGKI